MEGHISCFLEISGVSLFLNNSLCKVVPGWGMDVCMKTTIQQYATFMLTYIHVQVDQLAQVWTTYFEGQQ